MQPANEPTPLKDVTHGDGQLQFRIPAHWVATEEADGTGAFHDRTDPAGTLRVKLMTFTAEQDLSAPVAYRELQAMQPAPGQTLESLPGGNALRSHREEGVVDGEPTIFHVWMLSSVFPPHRMRLAVFSYTELASRADPGLVATLDREIRRARFGHQMS
jgi:hypothetical protein